MCNYDIPKNEPLPPKKKQSISNLIQDREMTEADKCVYTTKGMVNTKNHTNSNEISMINIQNIKVDHIILR